LVQPVNVGQPFASLKILVQVPTGSDPGHRIVSLGRSVTLFLDLLFDLGGLVAQ